MTSDAFRSSVVTYAAERGAGTRLQPHEALAALATGATDHGMGREEWLTWVLRPHRDIPPARDAHGDAESDIRVASLRRDLDDALDALTCTEVELQCGSPDDSHSFSLPDEFREPLCALARSQAFVRYLDAYLFFGVRFLLGRDAAIREAWEGARVASAKLPDQFNRPILLLATPPSLGLDLNAGAEMAPRVIRALSQNPGQADQPGPEEQDALFFLDGFHQKLSSNTAAAEQKAVATANEAQAQAVAALHAAVSSTPKDLAEDAAAALEEPPYSTVQDLELWLRGVLPDLRPNQRALPSIARGIKMWAIRHAQQYDSLGEQRDDLDGTVDRAEEPWRRRRCDTPRVTRVALLDLYWLAGVLRAEVTPAGQVTYAESSWLSLLHFREEIGLPLEAPPVSSQAASAQAKKLLEWPLDRVEEVLRSAFSSACELVQNAAELEAESNRRHASDEPAMPHADGLTDWRGVLDAELEEIVRQRNLRRFQPLNSNAGDESRAVAATSSDFASSGLKRHPGWSRRLFAGGHPRDLVGLAFSGGGIRSATFNLGVLQGLQELDLLRQVDFLSTVSGGGFIGSWLLGNVKRTRYWLTRQTPWDDSVALLRAYSNYLAPQTGFFSMDTWSLGTLWLRNTLLIQLSTLAGMLMLFTLPYLLRLAGSAAVRRLTASSFFALGRSGEALMCLAGVLALVLSKIVVLNLLWPYPKFVDWRTETARSKPWWLRAWKDFVSATWIRYLAALPAWLGAAIVFARIYGISVQSGAFPGYRGPLLAGISHPVTFSKLMHLSRLVQTVSAHGDLNTNFSTVLQAGLWMWGPELVASLLVFLLLLLVSLAVATGQMPASTKGWAGKARTFLGIPAGALGAAALCTAVLHLCFSAILYLYLSLDVAYPGAPAGVHEVAFLAGPALVMLSYSVAILLLIGLSGKFCTESQREWWTRFGSYTLVVALVSLLLCGIAFGSPWLIHWLFAQGYFHRAVPTVLLGWVGTTASGLLAGKSSKTSGEPSAASISLDLVAKVGGAVFLIGASVGAAELLYQFFHGFLPDDSYPHVSESIAAFDLAHVGATFVVLAMLTGLFSWFFEINIFGLNQLYRNRLVRAYMGASRWMPGMRSPEPFTRFDFNDDIDLNKFLTNDKDAPFRGPFPIINCTLNLGGSSDIALHTRHSASFSLTPLFCGANRPRVGYTSTDTYAGVVRLGQAIAVSGAAASPNMGYNTSPLVAFLLTMFNVRLGWWFPNPSQNRAGKLRLGSSLPYLVRELAGLADETQKDLNISDGGHFENLAIYELVRRNCAVIIAGDAECDEAMNFGGLANVIRLCETDFGAIIDIDVSPLRHQTDGFSRAHAAVGTIRYSNGSIGHLIYLKSSVTGDEDPTITQYRAAHPTFPHESTGEQFFSEDQFESYRRLGLHVVRTSFRCAAPGEHLVRVTQKMADMAAPPKVSTEQLLRHTAQLNALWERLGKQAVPDGESSFLSELLGTASGSAPSPSAEVIVIGLDLLQLMEDVFVDLELDDSWESPDHRGWAMLFLTWARSPRLRAVWKTSRRTFDIRFEYFCANRLGFERDHPVLRVTPGGSR